MNRKFFAFILLVAASLSLSSCLDSTDDSANIEYYHDTAITAFSLGSMDKFGKSKDGLRDSLLRGNVAGADYKFTIDQTKREIYNVDSLPVNTRTAAVLATISAKNSNYIQLIYKKQVVDADAKETDSLVWYNSTDSLNIDILNKDQAIKVYSQDALAYATYKLKVNVHTQRPDTFIWQSLAAQKADLAALTDTVKMLALNDKVVLFGKSKAEAGKVNVYESADGKSWSSVEPNVSLGTDAVENVVALDGTLYMLHAGNVLKSADAKTWTTVSANASLKQLIGASRKNLYAYTGAEQVTGIAVSTDKGVTWQQESINADAQYLPTRNVNLSSSTVRSTADAENVLLMGTLSSTEKNDTVARVWMRTVDNYAGVGNSWNYVEYDNSQAYKMPKLNEIDMVKYNDSYAVLGSDQKWYVSIDGGISWQVDTAVVVPEGFQANKPYALTRVKEKATAPDGTTYDTYIYWLVNGGNVWKGRYNKDGWLRKE